MRTTPAGRREVTGWRRRYQEMEDDNLNAGGQRTTGSGNHHGTRSGFPPTTSRSHAGPTAQRRHRRHRHEHRPGGGAFKDGNAHRKRISSHPFEGTRAAATKPTRKKIGRGTSSKSILEKYLGTEEYNKTSVSPEFSSLSLEEMIENYQQRFKRQRERQRAAREAKARERKGNARRNNAQAAGETDSKAKTVICEEEGEEKGGATEYKAAEEVRGILMPPSDQEESDETFPSVRSDGVAGRKARGNIVIPPDATTDADTTETLKSLKLEETFS